MKFLHAALDRIETLAGLVDDANKTIDRFVDEVALAYVGQRWFGSSDTAAVRMVLDGLAEQVRRDVAAKAAAADEPPAPISPAAG